MADKQLGGTITIGGDITVPRMAYGAMRLTGPGIWGDHPEHQRAIGVLRRVRDLGIGLIDTADAYGPETNETLIADALAPYGDLVIATKGGLTRSGPNRWEPNGRPEHLRQACDSSLKRLGLDRIDIYQFHRPDPAVPYAESIGTLAELQGEGKIRHIGISNVTVDHLRQAQQQVQVVNVQNRYNVAERGSEDVLVACEADGIAFFPWAPVGQASSPASSALHAVAQRHGATPMQIQLAWLLAHSPVIVPIPGTSSIEHLEENVASARIELTSDDLAQLDA